MVRDHLVLGIKKVDLRKRSTTATKNYIVETRQGPAPTNVPSEVQCKDRWYVGSLVDQARHQSGMYPGDEMRIKHLTQHALTTSHCDCNTSASCFCASRLWIAWLAHSGVQ